MTKDYYLKLLSKKMYLICNKKIPHACKMKQTRYSCTVKSTLMPFSLQDKSFFQFSLTFFFLSPYYHFTLCVPEVLDSSNSLFYMPTKSKGNFREPFMAYVNSNAKQTISLLNTIDATRCLKKRK